MDNPFPKEEPQISVVTPIYQDAWKTLPSFFQALSEQEYQKFEVLIVLDGPNQAARKEIQRQEATYPKMAVRVFEQEHAGAPAARNRGLLEATGELVTFTDPDVYWYPESFRFSVNAFLEDPKTEVVWGFYDIRAEGERKLTVGNSVPLQPDGRPDYYAFRYSNYCSGAFVQKRESCPGWGDLKSLQDWDMWLHRLSRDDFEGRGFRFFPRSFFLTEPPGEGGISHDSATNWQERVATVKERNGIAPSKLVVTSLGAPHHGLHVARKLGADYLPMPSFKPHRYEMIYLLGFYYGPGSTKAHMAVFDNAPKARKVIHWIGTDVLKMRTLAPFVSLEYLQDWFKKNKVVHLCEAPHIQKELAEIGIKAAIVPIPPPVLFDPIPLPNEFAVAVYDNPTQDLYRKDLMLEVARSLPDIKFYFFGNPAEAGKKHKNVEHLGWIDLAKWMPRFSLNLRVTEHDGLPITPLQFLTAGRGVVSNTPIKGARLVSADRSEIVEAIRQEQASPTESTAASWIEALDFTKYSEAIWALLK